MNETPKFIFRTYSSSIFVNHINHITMNGYFMDFLNNKIKENCFGFTVEYIDFKDPVLYQRYDYDKPFDDKDKLFISENYNRVVTDPVKQKGYFERDSNKLQFLHCRASHNNQNFTAEERIFKMIWVYGMDGPEDHENFYDGAYCEYKKDDHDEVSLIQFKSNFLRFPDTEVAKKANEYNDEKKIRNIFRVVFKNKENYTFESKRPSYLYVSPEEINKLETHKEKDADIQSPSLSPDTPEKKIKISVKKLKKYHEKGYSLEYILKCIEENKPIK